MGYRFVSLDDVYRYQAGEKDLAHNSVCLTFDDGHADYWQFVYPLQKKYRFKSTIFVNPEFVDCENGVRANLDDYWNSKLPLKEIDSPGHLSWEEMDLMISGGLVDIQSHTMTHTKYDVSDELTGFHFPGSDNVYPLWNLFPQKKPYYREEGFEKLLPYGYPLFKQEGAIVARKVEINRDFISEAIAAAENFDFTDTSKYPEFLKLISGIHANYKKSGSLVTKKETETEYRQRIEWELKESKRIIESKLNQKVDYCCWPMGFNTEETHQKALDLGYLATSEGKCTDNADSPTRLKRLGLWKYKDNIFLTRLKSRFRLKSFQKRFPYYTAKYFYYLVKHRRRP